MGSFNKQNETKRETGWRKRETTEYKTMWLNNAYPWGIFKNRKSNQNRKCFLFLFFNYEKTVCAKSSKMPGSDGEAGRGEEGEGGERGEKEECIVLQIYPSYSLPSLFLFHFLILLLCTLSPNYFAWLTSVNSKSTKTYSKKMIIPFLPLSPRSKKKHYICLIIIIIHVLLKHLILLGKKHVAKWLNQRHFFFF